MDHQMWTINLILLAVAYGGALERCGCVETLFSGIKSKIHNVGGLVVLTLVTSLFCDATMCDQFLGIGVPGPLYRDKYDEMGLAETCFPVPLRTAGPCGPLCSRGPAAGAYQYATLGVHPFVYFPYAFVNLLNPIYGGSPPPETQCVLGRRRLYQHFR